MAQEQEISEYTAALRRVLSPDMLKPKWAEKAANAEADPMAGHCYTAAQVLYHLLGGKKAGWSASFLTHALWPEGLSEQGDTHWYLVHQDGTIADPTASQFGALDIPYHKGAKGGFLTKDPDRRAREVMRRMAAEQGRQGGQCCA